MKKYLISGLVMLFSLSFAQRHEIGVKIGTASVYGDADDAKFIQLGPDNSLNIKTFPFTGSIFYKRNITILIKHLPLMTS